MSLERREGMCVCESDFQVWSREAEVSGRVGGMLRERQFPLALSMIHAGD